MLTMNNPASEEYSLQKKKSLVVAVLIASLGYFVDIYDLLLFSIIRVNSLKTLGITGAELTRSGIFLLNIQMAGMIIGGIFWGIAGDKKGRLSVLFGSIFLYSLANIANGFVHSLEAYSLCRFIAGFGLAGELGAGITLVAELMQREKRGYATTIVAAVGVCGAITAFFTSKYFDWRTTFFIGGALGLMLLVLRISVKESEMFVLSKQKGTKKGSLALIFSDRKQVYKYLCCIFIGIPIWFTIGVLITLSPEFGRALHVRGEISAGAAVACCYFGMVIGDVGSGLLSQYLKSRKKVVYIFLTFCLFSIVAFLAAGDMKINTFYIICVLLGCSVGYWAIFVTIAAEQFGTNVRTTVTTTVTNFVRGALIPISLLFQYLKTLFGGSMISAAAVVACCCILLALIALSSMQETFFKDLNYQEE